MLVKQIINPLFNSNTYVLSQAKSNRVWLIDIGEFEKVLQFLKKDDIIRGVFITHSHFDHIYGINALIDAFPDCVVYASGFAEKGLFSEKLNMSFYHEDPVVFKGSNIHVLREGDRVELFKNLFLEVLETPGHNEGSLSFKVGPYLFTGDSYIPNVKVVTKLKSGNRLESEKSLRKIFDHISTDTIVCPGHGAITKASSWK